MSASNPFYVTTPIYYVNDEPHLGHAYTTVLADVLAGYARLQGNDTFFLTGVDEHGQKVQEAALRQQVDPRSYVDEMQLRFKAAWKDLHIHYDCFIRTTEPRHVQTVQHVLQDLWERGEIYLGEYVGWYCTPDERFWTEKDLVDGACPDCGRPVEQIVESNYFFRMSAYQDWLIEYIQDHPDFILPAHRRNEVLGFLRRPLGDLCITRPVSRLDWGILLPFDDQYVTYVWFDALFNYVTAAGFLQDNQRFETLWPHAIHLIGKDILTTHCVYWPTMLKAAGLPQPQTIFAHGWWVIGGFKMSKSLGNVVKPLDLAKLYGADAFRYFLMRDMTLGQDADFDSDRLDARYSADLANNLGNLLHRVVNMLIRYCDEKVSRPGPEADLEKQLREQFEALPGQVFQDLESFAVNQALARIMGSLSSANQYLEQTAPWRRSKLGDMDGVQTSLYHAAEALRLACILLSPVMPERMSVVWKRLGWSPPDTMADGLSWGLLQPGSPVAAGEPLFPRLLDEPQAK